MKKLIKRIFRGKYYKNGESYVDTIVKVIICVVVGALLLTSVYAVAKSGLESAKNKVNGLLDYNPNGEDGPGGGDTSIPDGGDESEPEVPDLPQLAAPLIDIEGDTLYIIDEEGDADEFELYIDGEYTQDINAEPTTVFDLSVLSLEDGSHTIQCKAKAEGYQTSEFSNSVEYEVAAVVPYLTFQSDNPFTIRVNYPKWDGTMEYSTDTENWTTWDGSSISSVDGKVYLRGTENTRFSSILSYDYFDDNYYEFIDYSEFVINGTNVECIGNIETLLDWQTVLNGKHPTMNSYCFAYAFFNNSALIKAPELPATTLADECYRDMFHGCTSLTTAPALPATTLAEYCYSYMFGGCTNLTTAPALPATTLADDCYSGMFAGCTALTKALALPATTLATGCYEDMFYGCTALTTAPSLPATTLAERCYQSMFSSCTALTTAPELPATTLASYCYYEMFRGCTNLTTAPELPATTLATSCYKGMFSYCTSLTTASSLPATTLAEYCYEAMFYGCKSLTTAPELPATTLAEGCYYNMFYGCTALTTAPELPATTLATSCYNSMFSGCTALTTAPELPATTLANSCYSHMFSNCKNLTTAPELPATTLASYCYCSMFFGCTNLKVSATQTGIYQYEWRIPTEGNISYTEYGWNTDMLYNTGGTFKGNPAINTTYYLEYPPVG
jgi:hypothetical protein